jgi:hypothetical protein
VLKNSGMNINLGMQKLTCVRSHSRGVDRDVVEKSVKSVLAISTDPQSHDGANA